MLSIRHMSNGSENYYLHLAREDYYLEGGEPPGRWFGRSAAALGLAEREVDADHLRPLFAGYAPAGDPLVQNAGRDNRRPGWDLTFSAPKSVSTLWSQADDELRQRIAAAHDRAVREALSYIEAEATWTRRGSAGVDAERVGLLAALFEHGTSRAQQPQLHTHALVLNASERADGTWGSIRDRDFYQHKMTAGAVYRASFAHELRHTVGLDPTPERSWFELSGVSRSLMDIFSSRRREIEEAVGGSKDVSAARLAAAALATRAHKVHRPRSELIPEWHAVGVDWGFGPADTRRLPSRSLEAPLDADNILVIEPIRAALRELTDTRPFILERDLVRAAAERMQHGYASFATIRTAVQRELDNLVEIGNEHGYSIYATQEMIDAERDVIMLARGLQDLADHALSEIEPMEAEGLSPEQSEALDHITATPGNIKLVDGVAGSGKSSLLRAAKTRWEEAGYTVMGAAVAGKAARELEAASGIKSDTIAKTLHRLNSQDRPPALKEQTVLVLDEASMIGTLQIRDLLRHMASRFAKVVLVGDERQLPAIDAGSPFSRLIKEFEPARLSDVHRQRSEEQRSATVALSEGDVQTALSIYQRLGRLDVCENEKEAIGHLVGTWQTHRTADLSQSLMLASTNAEVNGLNELAQRVRLSRREIRGAPVHINDEQFHAGDRVRFTLNSRALRVWNGDGGEITSILRTGLRNYRVTVRLDASAGIGWLGRPKSRSITFSTASYSHLRLGYATTIHAAQGTTVERSFVLAGTSMLSSELSYVQLTRHRDEAYIVAPRGRVGEDIEAMAEAMSGSSDRRHAVDFAETGAGVRPRWSSPDNEPHRDEEQELSP